MNVLLSFSKPFLFSLTIINEFSSLHFATRDEMTVVFKETEALQNLHGPGQLSLMLVQILEQGMYVS